MLTQQELKKSLNYNKKTGVFTWLKSNSTKIKKGYIAGNIDAHGYRTIKINKKQYKAHRLAFLYVLDIIPERIDHIDRDKSNNRWNNLRVATRNENAANKGIPSTNTSGYKGVSKNKSSLIKPWTSTIKVNQKTIHLGYFKTKINAAKAYDQAAIKYFGKYAKLNFEEN